MSRATNTARSATQTVNGIGPGHYEFGIWVSMGIEDPDNKVGDFSQNQVSLFAQTSNSSAVAGTQPHDLTFGTPVVFGSTYYHTD